MADVGDFDYAPLCECPVGTPLSFPPIGGGTNVGDFDVPECECPGPPMTGDTSPLNILLIPASDAVWAGGLNRMATVITAPDTTHITYKTSDNDYDRAYTLAVGAAITPMQAPAAPAVVPGPFSYDTKTGLAITAVKQTLASHINGGVGYSSIDLVTTIDIPRPALDFPDAPGYLAFDFGFQDMVGPVKYLGRLSATQLLLDASFKFPNAISAGASVILLSSKSPFNPPSNKLTGSFYATDSASGRIAAVKTLDQITAAGIDLDVTVVYPGDRGLANEGRPDKNDYKIAGVVSVFGGNDLDAEIAADKKGV